MAKSSVRRKYVWKAHRLSKAEKRERMAKVLRERFPPIVFGPEEYCGDAVLRMMDGTPYSTARA